ncbi:MBL fold metallo-hydrolase, partial [Acinetobacter sp. A11]
MQQPLVKDFFDENTNTFSYVVADLATLQCAIIDSVLDYDAASATTKTSNADLIVDYVLAQNFKVQWILETHVHADHMTAAQYLKSKLGGTIAISQKISIVQETFSAIYNFDFKKFNENQPFDYL